jgi:hypothetical protein
MFLVIKGHMTRRLRRSLLALALVLMVPSLGLLAQQPERADRPENPFEDPIETDRDSFTPATKTAGVGRLILESAYSFIDNRGIKDSHSFPETLFRYGVTNRLELRLGWNYEVGGAGNEISSSDAGEDSSEMKKSLERESRIAYGMKIQATEQGAWRPESAFIVQAFTPTMGKATDTQLVGTYVFGWKLSEQWKFDSAIRYATASEGQDRFDTWAPSAVLKYHITERANVHGEYFGIFSANKSEDFAKNYVSPGVHYLITPNIEVGVRVGWGLNDQSSRFFSNVGFGVRF